MHLPGLVGYIFPLLGAPEQQAAQYRAIARRLDGWLAMLEEQEPISRKSLIKSLTPDPFEPEILISALNVTGAINSIKPNAPRIILSPASDVIMRSAKACQILFDTNTNFVSADELIDHINSDNFEAKFLNNMVNMGIKLSSAMNDKNRNKKLSSEHADETLLRKVLVTINTLHSTSIDSVTADLIGDYKGTKSSYALRKAIDRSIERFFMSNEVASLLERNRKRYRERPSG